MSIIKIDLTAQSYHTKRSLEKNNFRMLGGGGPDKMEQAMAMAAQNPHLEAENTKDFLALWTKMAVTCFERCVTNTQNSMIDQNSKEYSCIENCVGKVNSIYRFQSIIMVFSMWKQIIELLKSSQKVKKNLLKCNKSMKTKK